MNMSSSFQSKEELQVITIKKGETDTTLLKGQKSASKQTEHMHALTSLISWKKMYKPVHNESSALG